MDNVCWAKTKELLLPGPMHRSCGVRDSAIVMNSAIIVTTCNDLGYVRPAEPVDDVAKSSIALVYRGKLQPPSTSYTIAAGSNLVSSSSEFSATNLGTLFTISMYPSVYFLLLFWECNVTDQSV